MIRRTTRPDGVFSATAIVLAVGSLVLFLGPGVRLRVMAPALDLALDTGALVVTGCVATLAWMRYRERKDDHAAYQAAAFLALALANMAAVATTLLQRADSTLSATEPNAEQLVIFMAGHLLCGLLMVAGAVLALRGTIQHHQAVPLVVVTAIMLAVIALVSQHVPLPALVELPPAGGVPSMTPLGILLNLVAAGLFAVSALLYRRVGKRDGHLGDRYIAIGLLIGSFALVHSAVYPETHPGPVSSVNLLWLAVNLVLLLAIEAEAQFLLGATRAANQRLTELREVEVERAGLEERARLSRELHDGLAQDLWLAKLKVGRLAAQPSLDAETRAMVDDVAEVVEMGLAEARQAVFVTRTPIDSGGAFGEVLQLYLEDHADRFGLRVDFACDPEIPPLPARTQAELLRIAQEALSNVRRHAGAAVVTVRAMVVGRELVLRITDDGCGFDVAEIGRESFGIASMRERAAIAGGRLEVASAGGGGTRVEAIVPFPEGAVATGTLAPAGVIP